MFYIYYKEKTPPFFNLKFLLLINERGLSLESCLAICPLRASYLQINSSRPDPGQREKINLNFYFHTSL